MSATISTFITLDDISRKSTTITSSNDTTAVLKLIAEALAKNYDTVCLPITTANWKNRWTDMCLLPTGSDRDKDMAAEQRAEAWRSKPCFMRDEVTITRLGA